ncbi:hypothetical protein MLDJOKPK_00212 [Salmonella phage SPAsTU]|nr:hypothetical protein MLDJOKPK_00212 [Salmonella phage SPAsTU]
MQLPSHEVQIHAVNEWYQTTGVYTHGSYEQQRTKLYRCLGEIAEGVQKMDNLKVAAGIGRAIWTFIGLQHFSEPAKDVPLHAQMDHYVALKIRGSAPHVALHSVMLNAMDLVWNTPKEGDFDLHSFLKIFGDTLMALRSLCSATGLEFDRVVYNGHYSLIRKKGQMNELGMFIPEASDWDGDVRYASGATTRFLIESMISKCLAACFNPYKHRPFDLDALPKIQKQVNDTVDDAMERYVRHDPKWHGLLFERAPAIAVDFNEGNASAKMNDDLMFIINELKKDTSSNETISGLTA